MANKANSVVVVDAGIEAPLQLVAGLAFDAEILVLPLDRDGVSYVAQALQARPEATDVYVVAHGAPGQLFLGNTELSLATLPQHRDRLRQWTTQTHIQNIHFYGCRVAAGDAGAEFLSAIHALTHANIAASTHLLGHADQGGDWTLDAFWGEVERRSLLTADAITTYPGSLGDDNIAAATELNAGNNFTDTDSNVGATNEAGEPLHDLSLADATPPIPLAIQETANDSFWWQWTAGADSPVNINTAGSAIDTVLAVYSGPATGVTVNNIVFIARNDNAASGDATSSVTFNAVNGTTYYFAVDGVGVSQGDITITLDTPPSITPNQLFTVDENAAVTTSIGTIVETSGANNWTIVAGNPDNDGDDVKAFKIDAATGELTVNDPGDLDFEGFPTTYELTVQAEDGSGFSDTESVFIQVTDVNEAPEIVNVSVPSSTNEGSSITLEGQIFDPDSGDTQTVTIDWGDGTTATINSGSLINIDGAGNRTFTATHIYTDDVDGGFTQPATIKVSVEDAGGATDGPVTRVVSVINVAPEIDAAGPINITLDEDGSKGFLISATDASSTDVLTWTAGTPTNGTVNDPADPNAATQLFTYTPDQDFNGTDTFEVQVSDDDGGTDTVTVNVTVNPIADTPSALNISASADTINEGDSITLSGNFTDPDLGDTFTVTINWGDGTEAAVLTNADLTFNASNNTYFFSADHQFLTDDNAIIFVTVQDSAGLTVSASEAIAINNINPSLSPSNTAISILEDTPGQILFTAFDPVDDTFSWSIIDDGDNGQASVSATNTGANQLVTYTPNADFNGLDQFVVQVKDEDGGIDTANVTVFITPVNDDPVNLEVTAPTTPTDEGTEITLSGSFDDVDNSTEPTLDDVHSITVDWGDGTVETFDDTDTAIFDVATLTATKVEFDNLKHTYLDEDDGTYDVKVTITDKEGATVSTTREIQVLNVDPTIADPTVSPETLTTDEDTPIDFTVKADDVGTLDKLTYTVIDGPANGQITFGTSPENGVQNFTYTPNLNFDATDEFTLQVTDGDGGFVNQKYQVNITPDNDAPTIIVNEFDIVEDEVLPITLSVLDAQDLDGPAPLEFTIAGAAADSFIFAGDTDASDGITFTRTDIINGDVTFLYENTTNTPPAFTIKVEDAAGAFTTVPGNINFTAQDDDPVIFDTDADDTNGVTLGTFDVIEGASVLIDNTVIKATDEETPNRDLVFTVSNEVGGEFLLNGTPTSTFTQGNIDDGFVRFENDGTETAPSYTITVTDSAGNMATADGTGTVTAVNNPPAITVNTFSIVEDELLILDSSILNATDPDDLAADLTFTITGPANRGFDSFIVDGTPNQSSFTLDQLFQGQVAFLYENVDDVDPAFTIKVADDDNAAVTQAANIINFESKNDAPEFDIADADAATPGLQLPTFTVKEGGVVALDNTIINAKDEESGPSDLTFTVSEVVGGDFLVAGAIDNTFTQTQLNAGVVFFKHDGTETDPTYDISVTDAGGLTALATGTGEIDPAQPVNDPPTILVNNFAVTEGEVLKVTTSVLDAIDIDSTTEISFTVKGDAAGSFIVAGGDTDPSDGITFTRQDIIDGKVTFLYDDETTPTFTITANDQDPDLASGATVTVDGKVTFTDVNDVPVFLEPDGGGFVPVTDGTLEPFTVPEDGNLPITSSIIKATDGDFDDRDLTFTVADVEGGNFFLIGNPSPTTTFTQNDINLGRVFFANDGSETDGSYSISVTDGDKTATVTGVIEVDDNNDNPIITANNFTVVEDQVLAVGPTVLNGSDEETTTAADLEFTINGRDAGSFIFAGDTNAADGITFTLADVLSGQVTFLYENADNAGAPEFSITLKDNDATPGSVTEAGNIVGFTDNNDAPVLDGDLATPDTFEPLAGIEVSEGNTKQVTIANFGAVDEESSDANLTFEVTGVQGGEFIVAGAVGTTFTQAQVNAGVVFFRNEDTETVPTYTVTVTDGDGATSAPQTVTGTVIAVNDPPELANNQFAITEGIELTITTDILDAEDVDTADNELRFDIAGTDADSFKVNGTTSATFTRADILAGNVTFLFDGEVEPEFTIEVTDERTGVTPTGLSVGPVAAEVDFTAVNDVPEFRIDNDADPGTATAIPITEGGSIDLNTIFKVADAEVDAGLQTNDDLVFTIDAAAQGTFLLDGAELDVSDTFTQQDVLDGDVAFKHDGSNNAPSFTVTLNDNGVPTPESVTQSVTADDFNVTLVNDAPELKNNNLAIAEGKTVTLTTANLSAIDEETNALDLRFEITGVTNGQFSIDGGTTFIAGDLTVAGGNAFTLTDIIQGDIVFKHDDSAETPTDNAAPSYNVTVVDQGLDGIVGGDDAQSDPAAVPATITFTEEDDAPVLLVDTTTAGVPFSIDEDGILLLDAAAVKVDAGVFASDTDTPAEELVFTVSNEIGGFFAFTSDTEVAIANFTQADIDNKQIVFNQDGSESEPSFTLEVTDGTSSDLQNYTATLVGENDAPTINLNTLTLTEDARVVLTTDNLQVTDAETGPAALTYTVVTVENGSFINTADVGDPPTPITTFTQQDVIDGLVSFLHDGSNDAPTYTLTVDDDGTGSPGGGVIETSLPSDVVVDFTAVNDVPVDASDTNGLFAISQGGTVTINSGGNNQLVFTDEETTNPALLTYAVDEVNKGTFFLEGAATTTFTQQDLNLGRVSFQHDGSEFAPSYTVIVSDNGVPAPVKSTTLEVVFKDVADGGTFTNENDPPTLGNNELTIAEGKTVLFTTSNLSAVDSETANLDLVFTIADVINGLFTVNGTTFGEDPFTSDSAVQTGGTFTLLDVIEERVTFTHDGFDEAPAYTVKVTDDDGTPLSSVVEAATINFTRENDDPILISPTAPITVGTGADAITLDQFAFTISEGKTQAIKLQQINAADEPGETAQSDLTFEVSDVDGGFFALASNNAAAITEFTWVQVDDGDIVFKHDGTNVAPAYTLTVSDDEGGSTSADYQGALTQVNDAPTVTTNTLALTEEGSATIDSTVLAVTDEESTPAELTYTVSTPVGGTFQVGGSDVTTFTQADVIAGIVSFKDDGLDDNPPTFTLTLTDTEIAPGGGDLAAKTIVLTDADFNVAANFTAVNDEPTPDPFVISFPTVIEGSTISVVSGVAAPTEVQISVTDEESSATELVYTVDSIANASFTVGGSDVTTFTQAQIDANQVAFVHDGSEMAPTFTLSVQDNNGGAGANTLTQTVEPVFQLANEAPELTQNNLSPVEGGEVTLTTANLAASDREDLPTQLTFEITDVVGGTFFLNGNPLDTTAVGDNLGEFSILQVAAGALTFKDDGDETPPSYSVTVTDADPTTQLSSPTESAVIDLGNFPVNDAPEIETTVFPIVEGELLELELTNLKSKDPDNTDTELTYTVSNVVGGEFLLFDNTALQLLPTSTFTQQDVIDDLVGFQHDGTDTEPSFTITLSDGIDGTDSVTLSVGDGITFNEVNDAPVVVDDAFTTDEDTSLTNLAVTANDTDDSGTTLEITEIDGQTGTVTTTLGAEVTIAGGALNYNPGTAFNFLAAGESKIDTFTYTVSDNDTTNAPNNQTATGTVTITINGKNDAPITGNDTDDAFENGAITIAVLDNDTDPDTSDTLSISSVNTASTTGVVTIAGNAINYDPTGKFTLAKDATTTDTFTYVVDDGNGGTQTATVTVTVTGVNDLPIAEDDSGVGFETNDNQILAALNLLANDDDPDNDTFKITQLNSSPVVAGTVITLASGAEVTLNAGGTVQYDPTTSTSLKGLSVGQTQTETFDYTIADTEGSTDTATVSIVVNGVNEVPTILNNPLNFSTNEGTPISLDVLVAAGADDVDLGDTLTISSVSVGSFGTIANNGTSLTYTPGQGLAGGQVETENLTYTVSDGQGGTVDGQIVIEVTGINDPPVAVADGGGAFTTNEATAFTTASVLANDFDPEGGAISLQSVNTSGVRGLLTNNGNGTFTYDPNGVFNTLPVGRTTTDTFSYTISDDLGATATTTVGITVTGLLSDFLDFEKQLQLQNPAAVAPGDVVDVLPLAQLYDESFYLSRNPDVAALVAGGVLSSGYQHFITFGLNEGRNPSVLYDNAFYLNQNPDVAANVGPAGGLTHFLNVGHREGRDPSALFDQSDYLLNNPDIAGAVSNGSLASGFQHYVIAGVDENRLPNLSLFDAQFYLSNNPDVAAAGFNNSTAITHFALLGQFEGRQPSALYNEASYLALNPDIAGAVANGSIPNGFQHYQSVGRFEGRFVFPI